MSVALVHYASLSPRYTVKLCSLLDVCFFFYLVLIAIIFSIFTSPSTNEQQLVTCMTKWRALQTADNKRGKITNILFTQKMLTKQFQWASEIFTSFLKTNGWRVLRQKTVLVVSKLDGKCLHKIYIFDSNMSFSERAYISESFMWLKTKK